MERHKLKYINIFYSILAAILIVSWITFSSYQYMFILRQPNTLIFNIIHAYVMFVPAFGIYYFLGEYRIYKNLCVLYIEETNILDEFLLKK